MDWQALRQSNESHYENGEEEDADDCDEHHPSTEKILDLNPDAPTTPYRIM
jgi:hypothetical protein